MISFARSAGRILLAGLLLFNDSPSFAFHKDFENREYTRPALIGVGTITGIYVLSEMKSGPTLFATAYSVGSLYLMKEWYTREDDLTGLVVPLGLITLAVANVALLRDEEEFSSHDVFIYNLAGVGLLTSYAIWEHANRGPRRHVGGEGFGFWPSLDESGRPALNLFAKF